MDMSLRDWLILVGIIVIAVVLIDGYRRVRLAKKRATELSFGLEEVKGDSANFGSELPNGGARLQKGSFRDLKDLSSHERSHSKRVEPGLSGMGFDNDPEGESGRSQNSGLHEFKGSDFASSPPELESPEPLAPDFSDRVGSEFTAEAPLTKNSDAPKAFSEDDIPVLTEPEALVKPSQKRRIKTEKDFPSRQSDPKQVESKKFSSFKSQRSRDHQTASTQPGQKPDTQQKKASSTEKLSDRPPAKEVVIINVIAKGGEPFDGAALMQSLLASGMRYGDMSIFHRYSNENGTGKIMFSMANGVEPGYFNFDELEKTATPAVSFFMGLPGPDDPLKAFTRMVETAKQLALDLGGELKDEQQSVMTQQTIEHSRQRIVDYERKQLTQKETS